MPKNNTILIISFLIFSFSINLFSNMTGSEVKSKSYNQAFAIAEVVDSLIRSARANYTDAVVGKLKKDGTGASVDHMNKKGFAPLPAQFVRRLAADKNNKKFDFVLRSLWNLNKNQNLQNKFEKEGWGFLEAQQTRALKSKIPFRNIKWQPYVKVEDVGGVKTLRYMSADTASASSCVTCHNAYERKAEIKKWRKEQGVRPGKLFKMHELMGALSISVPLKQDN